jgi:hypothetical protein
MALGTELTLLAIDAGPEHVRAEAALPYALVVAELVDLAAAGRITAIDGRIEVLDRSPIGDVLADDTLMRLADLGEDASVEQWLERHAPARVEAYLAGLTSEDPVGDAVGPGAEAAAGRLRGLLADAREPLAVRDLAFAVLANATGWPRTHLRTKDRHAERARLRALTAEVAGSGEIAAYHGDAAFAVLRRGVRTAAPLAEQSLLSGAYAEDAGAGWGRRVLSDVVALLSLATIVVGCMKNVALAIILTPFCIALMAPSLVSHAERRRRRREPRSIQWLP